MSPPEPRSLGELADRLQRPGSVALCLPRLALPHLQVAEALAALGTPASRDALAELLGAADGESAPELAAALEALADRALVWPDGAGGLRMSGSLRQAWDAPLGLDAPLEQLLAGVTSEELRRMLAALGVKPPGTKPQRLAALLEHHSDPDRVVPMVSKAPAAARELLERRAEGMPGQPRFIVFDPSGSGLEPGERWALERGLLIQDRHRYGPARMPAEVARALRGPGWHAPFVPVPPVVRLAPIGRREVDHEASAAATAFTSLAVSVLSVCSATVPARLKSGGIGARELTRIGKAAQADATVVRLTLETAFAAGLLGPDGSHVMPTDAYDAWAEQEPWEQFAVLLRAWRDIPLTPTQARGEDDKALPAVADPPPCDGCVSARHGLLAAVGELPPGQGATVTSDLRARIAWHRPFAHASSPDGAPFAEVIREAEILGVVARGALSGFGVHLYGDDTEGVDVECRRLLPSATATARIGADLTAVVTGTPSARLARLLDSVADRESSGTASVWRFSTGSIRRALDAGHVPEDITADLAAVAAGPLPQPLTYLITDTARGHGRVRVAPAVCVIHGDEPALLAELAAHCRLAKLGLRQLAPTVLVSRSPLDTTLATLRAEGYAPVTETAEGTVRIEKVPPQRAAPAPVPPPRRSGTRITASAPVDPDTLAAQLLKAPATLPDPAPLRGGPPFATDTEEIVSGYAKHLSYADVRQLAHAIDTDGPITIEYVATSGNRTVRTLSDVELDPPYIDAWCHLRDDERVFTLSRIHGVMSLTTERAR